MDRKAAILAVQAIFANYSAALKGVDVAFLDGLLDGKLYEVYVLSMVIDDLDQRGFALNFVPAPGAASVMVFKGGPGMIKTSDAHFNITAPVGYALQLYVDIEFNGLGSTQGRVLDDSLRHEIDIVVTTATAGYPECDEILLGVECKAVANFGKWIVKETLGVRREMCYLDDLAPSVLTRLGGFPPIEVQARPTSEMWLAFIDPKGRNYSQSPAQFGVQLRHLQP